jgi:hypothetical protein
LNGNVCQSPTDNSNLIPNNYGANLFTAQVELCQDSAHCVLCKADIRICTGCIANWYVKDGLCLSPTTGPFIPDRYGANSGNGMAVSCSDSNCINCRLNFQICTACDTGSGWYLNGAICQHATSSPQMPSGFGPDLGLGTVVACSVANCLLCKSDNTICSGCNTGAGWYLSGNQCQHATSAPQMASRFGPDLSTGMVVGCGDSNCLLCKGNYQTCTGCDTATGWYLNGAICQHATSSPQMPSGFGPDLGLGTVVACSVPHCTQCTSDHTICNGCDKASGWYLHIPSNQCQSQSGSPVFTLFYGPNIENGQTAACGIEHCMVCSTNYLSSCTKCDTSTGWYLDLDATLCKSKSGSPSMSTATGADLQNGIIKTCTTKYCIDCYDNYQQCQDCITLQGFILIDNTCACDISNNYYFDPSSEKCVDTETLIDTGIGGNPATKQIENCTDTHCVDCHQNYAVCTKCDTASNYFLLNGSCLNVDNIPKGKGVDTLTGEIVDCNMDGCVRCNPNYMICLVCDVSLGYLLNGTNLRKEICHLQDHQGCLYPKICRGSCDLLFLD